MYHFVCPCGADGDLSVPINDRKPFPCPEGCGRVYVQWRDGPALKCVVEPVCVPDNGRGSPGGDERSLPL